MSMAGGRPRRFPWWIYSVVFLLIVAVAFAPIAITIYGVAMASAAGCQINMHVPADPCIVDGIDRGPDYQWMGNMFWALLYSTPLAFLLFILWCLVLLVHRLLWGRKWAA